MNKWDRLQAIHLDVLKEIGNIGVGNAATSLSQMIGKKIDMEVPQAAVSNLNQLIQVLGDDEEVVVCISLEVTGDTSANVFFILKEQSSLQLVDRLMGLAPGTYKELDDTGQSALQEVGNILTGSILNAMSSMTNLKMLSSVPAFANDMLGAVLSAALLERGYFDDMALIIETRFYDEDVAIDGYFFMLPQDDSLDKIFISVGVSF